MDASTFHRFCSIAYQKAGITLGPTKEALVSARVGKRLRALGLASEAEYLARLEGDTTGEETIQFLDVISTNHTAFFRESDHFELLRKLVPAWYKGGVRQPRIWSAASSTGEEPYSIAFTLNDIPEAGEMDWRILATDISTRVLKKAEEGRFGVERLTSLEQGARRRYFERVPHSEDVVVRPDIKSRIAFRRLNLAEPPYPMRGPFDIIFCRNVMIYFDQVVRQRVISAMERLLRPGGYLLIGHSEALSGIQVALRMLRPSVFVATGASP
jgi:chemotaxis protein methyltransferase CheR